MKVQMYKLMGKRLFDISLVFLVLTLLWPLFLVGFALVYAGDGRPFFFSQARIGRNLKTFSVYKFRTMKQGMDHLGTVSMKKDPRYFFGAEFLRASKIDELPQLLNILNGDMSLVGPRPTVQSDYDKMSDEQKKRADVMPGLTGLAQISGNTALKWPERIALDLTYAQNLSFYNDVKILALTLKYWLLNRLESNPPESGEW